MKTAVPLALALVAGLLMSPGGEARAGDGVPPYQAPEKVRPARTGEPDAYTPRKPREDAFKAREGQVADFAGAYARNGRPRLAIFWNRQLSDTLTEWYGEVRVTATETKKGEMAGDIALSQSGTTEQTTEVQQRVRDQRRAQPGESWEWEFQDGFLDPFLSAGATIIDRAAIMRITGADMQGAGERLVETRALQGMADLLIEVLVAPGQQSRTGYELRARVIEMKGGRILAYVNSRGLKEWNPEDKQYLAGEQGIDVIDPEEDETFGPVGGKDKYTVDQQGDFQRKRKPPKLRVISQNLAYNVMNGLAGQWK